MKSRTRTQLKVKPRTESSVKNTQHVSTSSNVNGNSRTTKTVALIGSGQKNHATTRRNLFWISAEEFLRLLFLDIPLLILFGLYASSLLWKEYAENYLLPMGELMTWTPDRAQRELTYFHRVCNESDQSTHNISDLFVAPTMTAEDASNLMVQHGAIMFPNLLSEATANDLREFILQQNQKNEDMIYVIENKNRWSFYLQVYQHPAVSKALTELLQNNPKLVSALERIAGRNPAVIECTTITSAYGAVAQHWHQDVVPETNGAKYARNFIPSYSLFIPLQNTTAGMGATGICPGTHMCAAGCGEFCKDTGFQLSGVTPEGNWPAGWGALVNQQTTHIGMAHTDPHAPHRVVMVITFAPRPRFGPLQLETRMIGMGGSYSLHWSQWGHTLRDFADPEHRMQQPWRTLRSLGLFKPANVDWGWDFFVQATQRLVNEDVGYSRGDFDEFLENGGFSFLPRNLQGRSSPDDLDGADAWIHFLKETTHLCEEAFLGWYASFVIVYLLLSLLLPSKNKGGKKVQVFFRSLLHVVLVHVIVGTAAHLVWKQLTQHSRAHNILQSRLFRVPHASHVTLQDLPASLPLNHDVLINSEMRSSYMETFTDVLEVVHPGNKAWNELMEHSNEGYDTLIPQMQQQLRSSLLQSIREDGRRIMTKNEDGNWAEADSALADWFCHRELLIRRDRVVGEAVKLLDFFLAETRFGYWRDTLLHQIYIPVLLIKLQDEILNMSRFSKEPNSIENKALRQTMFLSPRRLCLSPPRTVAKIITKRLSFPLRPVATEPYPGAWFKEGDEVEATYNGEFVEWYHGSITRASADTYVWTVEYDDGDVNENLCPRCIRPFKPYQLHEQIEVRVSEDEFLPALVVAVIRNEELLFNLKLANGKIMYRVPMMDIRRVEVAKEHRYARGDEVLAQFPGGSKEWFPGIIAKINSDGTYAVQYEDGDYATRVQARQIQIMTE